MPSRFTSANATAWGRAPVANSVPGPNVPLPVERNTDTVFAPVLTETRSSRPSPFRSPIATPAGDEAAARSVFVVKESWPAGAAINVAVPITAKRTRLCAVGYRWLMSTIRFHGDRHRVGGPATETPHLP